MKAPTEVLDTLSTTTSLGRVRGFTIELLFHLKDGAKRCRDLAEITSKTQPYVNTYLRNMRKYGLVTKEGVFWKLTVTGVDFFAYLSIVYNNIIDYRKKKERKKKEERKKNETQQPKKLKQISILPFARDLGLDDTERAVVDMLVDHYNDTHSKFLFFEDQYELAEKLKRNPQDVRAALMNLVQDNRIYVFRMRREGVTKIGLKKAFLELLNNE